jgi:hypothetical protein
MKYRPSEKLEIIKRLKKLGYGGYFGDVINTLESKPIETETETETEPADDTKKKKKKEKPKTYADMGWFTDSKVWDNKTIKKYSKRPYLEGDEFMSDWGKKGKIKVSSEGGVGAGVRSKVPENFDVTKPPKTLKDAFHMALAAGAETDAEAKGDDFSMGTHEVRDGKLTSEKAGWEGYSSPLEGFKARVGFTNKAKGIYRKAGYGKNKSDLELANILSKVGYATSPTYAANLKLQLNRLKYDDKSDKVVVTDPVYFNEFIPEITIEAKAGEGITKLPIKSGFPQTEGSLATYRSKPERTSQIQEIREPQPELQIREPKPEKVEELPEVSVKYKPKISDAQKAAYERYIRSKENSNNFRNLNIKFGQGGFIKTQAPQRYVGKAYQDRKHHAGFMEGDLNMYMAYGGKLTKKEQEALEKQQDIKLEEYINYLKEYNEGIATLPGKISAEEKRINDVRLEAYKNALLKSSASNRVFGTAISPRQKQFLDDKEKEAYEYYYDVLATSYNKEGKLKTKQEQKDAIKNAPALLKKILPDEGKKDLYLSNRFDSKGRPLNKNTGELAENDSELKYQSYRGLYCTPQGTCVYKNIEDSDVPIIGNNYGFVGKAKRGEIPFTKISDKDIKEGDVVIMKGNAPASYTDPNARIINRPHHTMIAGDPDSYEYDEFGNIRGLDTFQANDGSQIYYEKRFDELDDDIARDYIGYRYTGNLPDLESQYKEFKNNPPERPEYQIFPMPTPTPQPIPINLDNRIVNTWGKKSAYGGPLSGSNSGKPKKKKGTVGIKATDSFMSNAYFNEANDGIPFKSNMGEIIDLNLPQPEENNPIRFNPYISGSEKGLNISGNLSMDLGENLRLQGGAEKYYGFSPEAEENKARYNFGLKYRIPYKRK